MINLTVSTMIIQLSSTLYQPAKKELLADDPMWYSLPYHFTTLQKMHGPISVLPTTSC